MTREEKLYSMRTKDLVQYCLDHGIKVSQTRGQLKEARAGVIQRIMAVEAGEPTLESLVNEFNNLPDDANLAEIFTKLEKLSDSDQQAFMDIIAKS